MNITCSVTDVVWHVCKCNNRHTLARLRIRRSLCMLNDFDILKTTSKIWTVPVQLNDQRGYTIFATSSVCEAANHIYYPRMKTSERRRFVSFPTRLQRFSTDYEASNKLQHHCRQTAECPVANRVCKCHVVFLRTLHGRQPFVVEQDLLLSRCMSALSLAHSSIETDAAGHCTAFTLTAWH